MGTFKFTRGTRRKRKARVALIGPSGSGKTFTALAIASELGERVAVIDTENNSAELYMDRFPKASFCNLELFSPRVYRAAIDDAIAEGFDVVVIDSLSHAWMGKEGVLEQVDTVTKRSRSGSSFSSWREVTPEHNKLVDALVRANAHLVVTMRSKTEYVVEKDEKTGRTAPRKIGTAPVQRDGLEYEFDLVGDLDLAHVLVVTKTRCTAFDGAVIEQPGAEVGAQLRAWLDEGIDAPAEADAGERPEERIVRESREAAAAEHRSERASTSKRKAEPPRERQPGEEDPADAAPAAGASDVAAERKAKAIAWIEEQLKREFGGDVPWDPKPKLAVLKDAFGTGVWKTVRAMPFADLATAATMDDAEQRSRLGKVILMVKSQVRRPESVAWKEWPTAEAWEEFSRPM